MKFLKWAGGKTSSLPFILPKLQAGTDVGRYYEPFLGGGAVFFALQPRRAILSDSNKKLIDTYEGVCDYVELVIERLKKMPYDKSFFLEQRRIFNEQQRSTEETAANFIYLNRSCFNGIYRVNKKGEFNVPFGRYDNPTICDEPTLRAASKALETAMLGVMDFEMSLRTVQKGDRVYIDPPYTPASDTADFTKYTEDGFGMKDQMRLASCVADMAKRKVLVVVSAADTPEVRGLYQKKFFDIEELQVARAINSVGAKRGKVGELLITPKKGAF